MRNQTRDGGFTLLELMIVVAIMGILAALAMPTMLKFIKKSQTSEAREHVEKIYNGARIYYFEPHIRQGTVDPIQPQFPDSQPATPAVGCCSFGGKCPPVAADWSTDGWKAVGFSMDDPHYYQYALTSSGTGTASRFTAMAYGDLDCDGQFSTFLMEGMVGQDGAFGLAKMSRIDELE